MLPISKGGQGGRMRQKKEPRKNKGKLKKDYTSTEVHKNLNSNKPLLNSFLNTRKWIRMRNGLSGQ